MHVDRNPNSVDVLEAPAGERTCSLVVALATGRRPGRQAERHCLQHALRLEEAITFWNLPVDCVAPPGGGWPGSGCARAGEAVSTPWPA